MALTVRQAQAELNALGYSLIPWAINVQGEARPWCTRPHSSGPINYFNNLTQVEKYIKQVKEVRSWQTDTP